MTVSDPYEFCKMWLFVIYLLFKIYLLLVGKKKWPLKDVLIKIPRTCEYFSLYGKRDFADV